MHQSHHSQQQTQSQQHSQSHHSATHAHNHQHNQQQQQHNHHTHHQASLSQQQQPLLPQQHHPMQHSQSQPQGPPPPVPTQHHHHQPPITHHHNQHHSHHPQHHQNHHHNANHHHHHHNPNNHHHPPQQPSQPHQQAHQQQPAVLPLQHSQHPQAQLTPMSGPMHPASQAQAPQHPINQGPHQHQPHPIQTQQPPHPHSANLMQSHSLHGGQHPPQQQQHAPHTGQTHNQHQQAPHHATGAPVQQHRQQTHQHVHPHQQPHHQHTHHQQSQPPHQIAPGHHSVAHGQPILMNQYSSPNMVYPMGAQAFPGVPPPPAFSQQSPAGGMNSQQQQASLNPSHMPPLNQMAPPVISTSATGTANVHHQSNGSVIDSNVQPRLSINQPYVHMPPYPLNMVPHYPSFQAQNPGHMHPSTPYIMSRLPDMGHNFRPPTYDPQAHPIVQPAMMVPKPPGAVATGPIMGVNSTPSAIPSTKPPLQKRERRPALLANPITGEKIALDSLKQSTESAAKKQEIVETIETPSSIATSVSATVTPSNTSSPTNSSAETSLKQSVTPTTTKLETTDSLENKMDRLSLQSAPDTGLSQNAPAEVIKHINAKGDVLSPAHTPPVTQPTPSNGSSRPEPYPKVNDKSQTTNALRPTTTISVPSPVHKSTTSSATSSPPNSKEVIGVEQSKQPAEQTAIDEPDRSTVRRSEPEFEPDNNPIVEKSQVAQDINEPSSETAPASDDASEINDENQIKLPDLPYQDGQYSPLNPSGRRKYTREFLLEVRALVTPEQDRPMPPDHARVDFMAPSYINTPTFASNYRDTPSSRRSSQQIFNRPRKVIPTSSLQPEIELKTTENAWKPELDKEKSMAVTSGDMDTTRLLKVFRGHLNKLTPQKYDTIIEKVAELDLSDETRLVSVIDLVFDKAVDEPGFCELYAKMCRVIGAKHKKFFNHLIKRCQEEFETNDLYDGLNVDARKEIIEAESDHQKKKMLSEELYEDMRLRRKKYLGTIKLIGEMYKFGLLIPEIIFRCMKHLIEEISNENLECLCSLLATVGAKMASEENPAHRQPLQQTLRILHDLVSKRIDDQFALESRVRFKILDTIDLSKKNWKPRMVENNPKKIEELREEVKEDKLRQQQQQQMNHSSHSRNPLKNDDRDRQGKRLGGSTMHSKNQNSKWT